MDKSAFKTYSYYLFHVYSSLQCGEHSAEKKTLKIQSVDEKIFRKHTHSEEILSYIPLKCKQKSLKSENSLNVLQPEFI
jgi:hypothetical protein